MSENFLVQNTIDTYQFYPVIHSSVPDNLPDCIYQLEGWVNDDHPGIELLI